MNVEVNEAPEQEQEGADKDYENALDEGEKEGTDEEDEEEEEPGVGRCVPRLERLHRPHRPHGRRNPSADIHNPLCLKRRLRIRCPCR